MTNGRVLYFDILKLSCCFLVVLGHDAAYSIRSFDPGLHWMALDLLRATAGAALPGFLMVSGALLLPRPMDDLRRYYIRCSRYLVPILAALVVYRVNQLYVYGESGSFLSGILYNIGATRAYHLWYMWMLLGLLLAAPLLQCFVANTRTMGLFLALWTVFCLAVPTAGLLGLHFPVQNQLFFTGAGYFVLGHALHRNAFGWTGRWTLRQLAWAAVVLLVLTAALVYMHSRINWQYREFFYSIESPTAALLGVAVFLWCQQRFSGQSSSPLLSELSAATYSVYLYHILFQEHIQMHTPWHNVLTIVCITTPLTLISTFLFCLVCRRVPYLKRLFMA